MLEPQIASILTAISPTSLFPKLKVWAVFILCLLFSGVGVGLSFFVFGPTITGFRLWGLGLALAVIMLGITYGAKYANTNSREEFSPIDLIQYTTQGFLWPSTWPALAERFGIDSIDSPTQASGHFVDSCIVLIGAACAA